MILTDTLTLDAPKITRDGYMAVRARAARVGTYDYLGSEVDPTGAHGFKPSDTVKVYRDEAEVFSPASVHSFILKPITDDHPSERVTADNWSSKAKGVVAGAMRDGDYLAFDLVMMDAALIDAVKSGKRELSNGYSTDLDFTPGTAPDGTKYDARQTAIAGNHVAVVRAGRAGSECRIADSVALCDSADRNLLSNLDARPMKTIVHDGISIEFADQAADAYNAVLAKLTASTASIAKLTSDHAAAIAAADAKLGKAEAERDAALGKVMDAAALDKAVTERADLISTARAIHDADYTGKSAADIRKAVLVAKGVTIDGKSEAYIDARFDVLAEDAKSAGRVVSAIAKGVTQPTGYSQQTVDTAAAKSVVNMNAWRDQA